MNSGKFYFTSEFASKNNATTLCDFEFSHLRDDFLIYASAVTDALPTLTASRRC